MTAIGLGLIFILALGFVASIACAMFCSSEAKTYQAALVKSDERVGELERSVANLRLQVEASDGAAQHFAAAANEADHRFSNEQSEHDKTKKELAVVLKNFERDRKENAKARVALEKLNNFGHEILKLTKDYEIPF